MTGFFGHQVDDRLRFQEHLARNLILIDAAEFRLNQNLPAELTSDDLRGEFRILAINSAEMMADFRR